MKRKSAWNIAAWAAQGSKFRSWVFGAGGPSRLGQRDNRKSEAESVALVQKGLDAGINFIDTAEAYRTEDIVGKAIANRDRQSIVISSKKSLGGEKITAEQLRTSLDASLRRLRSDYIDIYHLHGLRHEHYDYYYNDIIPVMQDLRSQGKIRFIGVTESWNRDLQHLMLQRALQDDIWDVFMVGFNLLNQTARSTVFTVAQEQDIGVLIMFAIRRALSQMDKLRLVVRSLIETGELDARDIDLDNPLGFLLAESNARSIPDAAYRFCRDEAGVHVVLSGTSKEQHLMDNIAALQGPTLADPLIRRLRHIFRNVTSVSGE